LTRFRRHTRSHIAAGPVGVVPGGSAHVRVPELVAQVAELNASRQKPRGDPALHFRFQKPAVLEVEPLDTGSRDNVARALPEYRRRAPQLPGGHSPAKSIETPAATAEQGLG
jgi:hypothetical protein